MTHKYTSGPAFPHPDDGEGMTLRDYFAGQALAGLLAGSPDADCGAKGYAYDAYGFADAMLEARK